MRRRDRINAKMKALRELIPRCNKMDKASMLEDAIEYTKSLQMQLQMMSMGYTMFPMMYPGMQQYLSPLAAATVRMRAETGGVQPVHPMMPFSPTVQGSTQANYTSTMPNFQALFPSPMTFSEQSRAEGADLANPGLSTDLLQSLDQAQISKFPDSSYYHYFGDTYNNSKVPHQKILEATEMETSSETKLPCKSNG